MARVTRWGTTIDRHSREISDIRNFDREGRFTYADWDKQVQRIGFDIWPQDNYHAYPKVQNAEIIFLGMTATNGKPTPDTLPHKGKAIWRPRPNAWAVQRSSPTSVRR